MRTVADSILVLCALVCMASVALAQTPVGALAIDERRGDQYGWAVDYETAAAAQAAALSECGAGCSVMLTFERCAAYAADQDADSTAVGWAESFASAAAAQQAALSECSSRGGTGCIIRVWGCNGPVVEQGLGLDRAASLQIQRGLHAAGFDPGGADGMFGPRHARGDPGLAVVSRSSGDGVSGRSVGSGVAVGRGRSGGRCRRAACGAAAAGDGGAGDGVLAVDREQHEPCGIRGVSAAVPGRDVQRAGADPP